MRKAARLAVWTLVAVTVLYLGLVALLWSQQTRLIYPAPREVASLTRGYDEVALATDDGLTLRAFYYQAAEGQPTLVYFHGNGGSLTGASYETVGMAAAGLGTLLVEYRGYGGNPGEPSEEGFYRDGRAAMAWLAARGVEPAGIVIIGNSIGSGPAVQMAVEFEPRALVLTSPFTSLPDAGATRMWFLPVRQMMRDRFDNLSKVDRLEIPLLVLHGSDDMTIPAAHGRALAEAAPRGELQLFDGEGHGLSFTPEAQQAIVEWIEAL